MVDMKYHYDKEYYVREISQRWRDYRGAVGQSEEYTLEDVKNAFVAAVITAFGNLSSPSLVAAAKELINTPEHEI